MKKSIEVLLKKLEEKHIVKHVLCPSACSVFSELDKLIEKPSRIGTVHKSPLEFLSIGFEVTRYIIADLAWPKAASTLKAESEFGIFPDRFLLLPLFLSLLLLLSITDAARQKSQSGDKSDYSFHSNMINDSIGKFSI